MMFSFSGQVVNLVVWADQDTPTPPIDEDGGSMSSAATSLEVLLIERVTLSLFGVVLLLLFGRAPEWLSRFAFRPVTRRQALPEIFSAFPRHFADIPALGRARSSGANPSEADACCVAPEGRQEPCADPRRCA